MKFCEHCGTEIATKDGDNVCAECEDIEDDTSRKTAKKRAAARAQRKALHQALTDLGLTRVKGALGGIYYE